MSREIKFRAWDTETNEMSYDFLAKGWLRVGIESPYVELMQYTGLKDKNGAEVYDRDIISYTNQLNRTRKFIVHWSKEDASYDFGGIRVMYAINGEVIGNIYENPELLDQHA